MSKAIQEAIDYIDSMRKESEEIRSVFSEEDKEYQIFTGQILSFGLSINTLERIKRTTGKEELKTAFRNGEANVLKGEGKMSEDWYNEKHPNHGK